MSGQCLEMLRPLRREIASLLQNDLFLIVPFFNCDRAVCLPYYITNLDLGGAGVSDENALGEKSGDLRKH